MSKHVLVRDVSDDLHRKIKRFGLEEAAALGSSGLSDAVKELCRRALASRETDGVVRGDSAGTVRRGE